MMFVPTWEFPTNQTNHLGSAGNEKEPYERETEALLLKLNHKIYSLFVLRVLPINVCLIELVSERPI